MVRIATVFGATGNQGAGVVDALLADGTFKVRAVTRKLDSEKALKLKARGVDVVFADLNSKDTAPLDKAMEGSEVVFGLTNYWDAEIFGISHDAEIEHGKRLIDAAKRADVKFLVWSSLPDVMKFSHGKYKNVHHFNLKIYGDDYLAQSGVPYAIAKISWYAENVLNNFNTLKETPDGTLEFPAYRFNPTAPQAIAWCHSDVGVAVLGLFKTYDTRRDEVVGHTFNVAGTKLTYPEYAKILSEGIGKPVKVTYPEDAGLLEMNEMYDYMVEFGIFGDSPIPDPKLTKLGIKFRPLSEFASGTVRPKFV